MKKNVSPFIWVTLAFALQLPKICFSKDIQSVPRFEIRGEIKGLVDGTKIFLTRNKEDKPDTVGIAVSKNNHFYFKGKVDGEADWYFLQINNEKDYMPILLENGTVIISGMKEDWPHLTLKGSDVINGYVKFNQRADEIKSKIDLIEKDINKSKDTSVRRKLSENLVEARKELDGYWKIFVQSNPNSPYTAFLLMGGNLTLDERIGAYEKLSGKAKASLWGQQAKEYISMLKARSTIKLGSQAPSFTSLNQDRQKLIFKDMIANSKLTLIDFWASWCKPCRAEIPNIREAYRMYKDKGFNIVSVSLDFNEKSWKEAIKTDSIIWTNVSELKGRDESVAQLYNVNGVPAHVLIDSEGKIIALDLQGTEFPLSGGSLRGNGLFKTIARALGEPIPEFAYDMENKKFLEENKKRNDVFETASGLQYEILKSGNGPKPTPSDIVKVQYTGKLINGKVFDSSIGKGDGFITGVNQVIEGWKEVLPLMPVGSKWKVYIPSNLAYGDYEMNNIPPGSTLIFEMELKEIVN